MSRRRQSGALIAGGPFRHLSDPRSQLDLLALGGQQLLDLARDEAGEYVARECRWDGVGDEPAHRAPR
jgi:hypothetical protein